MPLKSFIRGLKLSYFLKLSQIENDLTLNDIRYRIISKPRTIIKNCYYAIAIDLDNPKLIIYDRYGKICTMSTEASDKMFSIMYDGVEKRYKALPLLLIILTEEVGSDSARNAIQRKIGKEVDKLKQLKELEPGTLSTVISNLTDNL